MTTDTVRRGPRAAGRVAAAPISWGVCEVPGWGHQLPADLVLGQMREAGLRATEFGPPGFLPSDPAERAAMLRGYGLAAVGGFVPVVLHEAQVDPLPVISRALDEFGEHRRAVLVIAAVTGRDGYDSRAGVGDRQWRTMLGNLDRCAALAASRGYRAALHPHWGTLVARQSDVDRLLTGCGIGLCLDTGHLLIGGVDPARLCREAPGRVSHVHLKDVDAGWAGRVAAGVCSYSEAVAAGMYRPLGQGDVDVAGVVTSLESSGYQDWYVLEQDRVLAGAADPAAGVGPLADIRESLAFLAELL